MLRTLDLFSGIGGFSYALKPVAKTVAYCEIKQDCRNVLTNLIKQNKIDNCNIYHDVCEVKGSDLSDLQPELLTAGFPCQDIASCNPNGKGLKGSRTGLFYEIVRIIDETPSINYVLLENSPIIKTKGLRTVKNELHKRKFKLVWGYFEARMVGALHKRKRWICFAYRNNPQSLKQIPKHFIDFDWTKDVETVVPRGFTEKKRCMMLGNAVVPQVIRYAWNILLENAHIEGEVKTIKTLKNNDKKIFLYDGNNTIIKDRWATPTYTRWEQYRKLTDRGAQMLSNQIYYNQKFRDLKIPRNMRDKHYSINPNFVEHLMGYPKDWTKA